MQRQWRGFGVFAGVLAAAGLMVSSASAQREIYSDKADAKAEIQEALDQAKAEHKRVILDFGGNWCGDCRVLDTFFHDPSNFHILNESYVLVDVNVGRYDKNLDVAAKYGIPLEKGVPALVVLAPPRGRVIYAQTHGEFEQMQKLESADVTRFLMQYREPPRAAPAAGTGRAGR